MGLVVLFSPSRRERHRESPVASSCERYDMSSTAGACTASGTFAEAMVRSPSFSELDTADK